MLHAPPRAPRRRARPPARARARLASRRLARDVVHGLVRLRSRRAAAACTRCCEAATPPTVGGACSAASRYGSGRGRGAPPQPATSASRARAASFRGMPAKERIDQATSRCQRDACGEAKHARRCHPEVDGSRPAHAQCRPPCHSSCRHSRPRDR